MIGIDLGEAPKPQGSVATNITPEMFLAKLLMAAIVETTRRHAKPMADRQPNKRLGCVLEQAITGILADQTSVGTGVARHKLKTDGETWSVAKHVY